MAYMEDDTPGVLTWRAALLEFYRIVDYEFKLEYDHTESDTPIEEHFVALPTTYKIMEMCGDGLSPYFRYSRALVGFAWE